MCLYSRSCTNIKLSMPSNLLTPLCKFLWTSDFYHSFGPWAFTNLGYSFSTQQEQTIFALELHASFLMLSDQYPCTFTFVIYGVFSASQLPPQQVKKAFKGQLNSFKVVMIRKATKRLQWCRWDLGFISLQQVKIPQIFTWEEEEDILLLQPTMYYLDYFLHPEPGLFLHRKILFNKE